MLLVLSKQDGLVAERCAAAWPPHARRDIARTNSYLSRDRGFGKSTLAVWQARMLAWIALARKVFAPVSAPPRLHIPDLL